MLIAALDNEMTLNSQNFREGENGHYEYTWSKDIKEQIVQFHFQVTRTDNNGLDNLKNILTDLLKNLVEMVKTDKITATYYLAILYKMIGFTRDIIDGKGECSLTYMMILTWYSFFPSLAFFAIKTLVDLNDTHPYGSWKDIKYFCKYCKMQKLVINHPLIQYCIELLNNQLKKDTTIMLENPKASITLLGKWVPREKSSFGWLYEKLAVHYFIDYIRTSNSTNKQKAILKCKTEYRKLCSALNKHIDTLQIKQCDGRWAEINFDNVTSISMLKQKNAFMNKKMKDTTDRIECAIHFKEYVENKFKEKKEIKGSRVCMADFTKQALLLLNSHYNVLEKDVLNSQWRDNLSKLPSLGKIIAMVDVSGSMNGDPKNVAIALGIQIAEKSVLGKRVMTFAEKPEWVDLDDCTDFISQVEAINKSSWGFNTNFHLALDNILDVIVKNKLPAEEVENLTLVILSDMQMDSADDCNKDVLYILMKKKYELAGRNVCGKAYNPPHILFWNLRSTSGFPSLSTELNTSMMSGFSPSLLKIFCEKGMDALKTATSPWSILEESLQNDRYQILHEKLLEVL
jgi:hypothetical protein